MAGPILVNPGQTVGSGDWDALVQQHGGMPSVGQRVPVDDPNVLKLLEQPGMGAYLQQHPVYRYYFADGTYVDTYTDENGQDAHIVDYKPSARFTQQHPATGPLATGSTVPTNTTDPNIVTRMPDGTLKTDPNPNYRTQQIEGKPDPSKPGGYDNDHPVMVTHDASGAVVGQPRELTPDESKSWQASRSASIPASDKKPVEGHSGVFIVTTKNPQTNQTETHYEDASGQTIPQPSDTKNENITYRKNAAGQIEKVTTTTVNGAKSETVAPVLASERTQIGTKTSTANGKTVKTTTWQLPDGSKIDTSDEAVDAANEPIPAGAPTFAPVYGTDDLGLGDYDKALRQAAADNIITVDQGRKLMETAVGLATEAHTHGLTLRSEAATARTQDINQRQQDLGEVQSRRTAANDTFSGLYKSYDAGAQKLMGGDEGLATQAFLTALKLAPANAQAWGGMDAVPQVGPAYQQAVGGPSVTVHPNGAVQVQHPAPLLGPPGAPTNVQPGAVSAQSVAAPPPPTPGEPGGPPLQTTYPAFPTGAGSPGAQSTPWTPPTVNGVPTINPATGEPTGLPTSPQVAGGGNVMMAPSSPYMAAVGQRPAFSPDVAALKAQGFSDAEINEAWRQHQAEMGTAA